MKNLLPAVFCVFLFACNTGNKKIDEDQLTFDTTDPSRLYFNNVRSSYYAKTSYQNTDIDVYTHDDFEVPETDPYLYISIANNWMNDKAMLLPDTANWVGSTDQLSVFIESQNSEDENISLKSPTPKERFVFCRAIYKALKNNKQIYTLSGGEKIYLLKNTAEKTAFRITYRDYLKLIEED